MVRLPKKPKTGAGTCEWMATLCGQRGADAPAADVLFKKALSIVTRNKDVAKIASTVLVQIPNSRPCFVRLDEILVPAASGTSALYATGKRYIIKELLHKSCGVPCIELTSRDVLLTPKVRADSSCFRLPLISFFFRILSVL